jgi:triphosphoribosyl-dephospho-CoA synthase
MNSSSHFELERLAAALAAGAMMELRLTPKPGLVDLLDNGSHPDLSLPLMERSIGLVTRYLEEVAASLRAGEAFARQQEIAVQAERQLFADLGTNTHKGYIFLAGMLLIACHHADAPGEDAVRRSLSAVSRAFFHDKETREDTHGERARRRFKTGGIVREAIEAYPSLFEEALPVFRQTMARRACLSTASYAMLARLMQTVDDTTTLHRGGREGLARVRRDGQALERIVAEDGDCVARLKALNREYQALHLTIGGVADMLGLAFGWLIFENEIDPSARGEEQRQTESGVLLFDAS